MLTDNQKAVLAVAESLGLSMRAQFVPWSQSRAKAEKQPSLNWVVTLAKDGRDFLTTDYGAGCGHCPSYKQTFKPTVDQHEAVRLECETGKPSVMAAGGVRTLKGRPFIMPDFADVLHSLVSDADVLNYDSFEQWAPDLGYDADSRKAEAVYRACLEIAIKLRNAIGEAGMTTLQEALQDY